MKRVGAGFFLAGVITASVQGQDSTEAGWTVAGQGGTTATLSNTQAVIMPAKGYEAPRYGELFRSIAEANRNVARRLGQIDAFKEVVKESLENHPHVPAPLHLRVVGDDEETTSPESAAELDELTSQTEERLRNARLREQEVRRSLEKESF